MARINKGIPELHNKAWGQERWVENTPDFCGKFLEFMYADMGTTMHFHALKSETMFVQEGKLQVDLIDTDTGEEYTLFLLSGEKLFIPRLQPHRLTALAHETTVVEFSSHHEESDSYRVGPRLG